MLRELMQIYRTYGGVAVFLWPFVAMSVFLNIIFIIDIAFF
jgi:hypothetical protein